MPYKICQELVRACKRLALSEAENRPLRNDVGPLRSGGMPHGSFWSDAKALLDCIHIQDGVQVSDSLQSL
jgi:hypothetical protein